MTNEKVTLTAGAQDTNLLKDAHLGMLLFEEYNPKFERYPLTARILRRAAMERLGRQDFKWSVQPIEPRYVAPAPAGGATVGIYTAVDHESSSFTTGGSTPITAGAAYAANTYLWVRLTLAQLALVHPLTNWQFTVMGSCTRNGATVTAALPGRCLVDVVSLSEADTGYGLAKVKVRDDGEWTDSAIRQAVVSGRTVVMSLVGPAMPEGSKFPGGHMTDPVEYENNTQIVMRAFGATRSRAQRKEKFEGTTFDERLQNQALDTMLTELEHIAWWGKYGKETSQTGAMLQRDYGTSILGDRWYTGGVRDMLLRYVLDGSSVPTNYLYVPNVETIGDRDVSGLTWFEGFMEFYKGLAALASLYTPKATIPVYCGSQAYADTIDALEALFSRQVGESTSDTYGFKIRRIEIDGTVFEFRRNLSWCADSAYSRVIGIVDPDTVKTKVFGDDGDFRLINQKSEVPKSVDVGDVWVDGYTKSYFWDGGFVFEQPKDMFIVDGVGLDFHA